MKYFGFCVIPNQGNFPFTARDRKLWCYELLRKREPPTPLLAEVAGGGKCCLHVSVVELIERRLGKEQRTEIPL